ncbi:right-handed parallel beta-helix repeat-containing protein [Kitasatospora atroaurantiaca]|uniref:Pectate lyase-like protein n=1 Tax=Kitasatospora atroaurantiaca TaxID=285545 RepID=A0A561EW09_9ACTN|nr:right-handed parallel beta-helix repeat-containing protein [Kitasatospora atroaurantiaca]TWE19792.1 pectate lyase-like protein [Kitasatospora atroaurantiaca]
MRRRTLLIGAGGLLGAWGIAELVWVRTSSAARNTSVFNVRDYGASGDGSQDDTDAFKLAFKAARDAGGAVQVLIPPGHYPVSTSLIMSAGMTVTAYGARIVRGTDSGALLKNFDGKSNAPGYSGPGGLVVQGGTWDMAGGQYTDRCDAMAFGHAEDIRIEDCTILEVPSAHAVELNGVRKVRVVNCVFDGLDTTHAPRAEKEAVQITAATSNANLPFGPHDDTPCDDIELTGCTLRASASGSGPFGSLCGDHGGREGVLHSRIRVIGNHVEAAAGNGVRVADWQDSTIQDNTVEGAQLAGIEIHSLGGNAMSDIRVEHNTIRRTGRAGIAAAGTEETPVTGLIVTGNTVAPLTGQPGIQLEYAPRAVVSGNTTRTGLSPGVQVQHSQGTRLTANSEA